MKKNYLITTGGSGGHVIPAVILYEHLSRDAKVIITTDKRGLKYLNDGDYQLRIIDTPRLNNIFLFIVWRLSPDLESFDFSPTLIDFKLQHKNENVRKIVNTKETIGTILELNIREIDKTNGYIEAPILCIVWRIEKLSDIF